MSAPPPPPPPPPQGISNAPRPDNKNLLTSICKGTTLKKVPDTAKNDRSSPTVGKPKGGNTGSGNMNPLVPPGGGMSYSDAILARKNVAPSNLNVRKPGVPPPNAMQSSVVPPPPSQNKKPTFLTDTKPAQIPNLNSQNTKPINFPPPPPISINHTAPLSLPQFPVTNSNMFPPPPNQVININVPPPPNPIINNNVPPPPPPKEIKPRFRPPVPICSKPTFSEEKPSNRGFAPNQGRGPIPPPPPPFTSLTDGGPPKFNPPPPPPQSFRMTIPAPIISQDKPMLPIRTDSNCNFDSRFTFLDPKYFPDPKNVN